VVLYAVLLTEGARGAAGGGLHFAVCLYGIAVCVALIVSHVLLAEGARGAAGRGQSVLQVK
jgi:hypothetical protein